MCAGRLASKIHFKQLLYPMQFRDAAFVRTVCSVLFKVTEILKPPRFTFGKGFKGSVLTMECRWISDG